MQLDNLEFEDREFHRVRELIRRFAGISLAESKRALVQGRLAPRVRALKVSVAAYLDRVEQDPGEREAFINALTTNVTDFFREKHHFEALQHEILPRLYTARAQGSRRLRVWAAGCSTGEGPYTIAMTLLSTPPPAGFDVKILATDLDSNVVARAAAGVYPLARVEPVPPEVRKRFFQSGKGAQAGFARVVPELRELITFRQLNLMEEWPLKNPFDVIFCRNVMIYFDEATRRRLVDRFVRLLAPDGVLMLGHSESMMGMHPQLHSSGRTIFEKQHARAEAA